MELNLNVLCCVCALGQSAWPARLPRKESRNKKLALAGQASMWYAHAQTHSGFERGDPIANIHKDVCIRAVFNNFGICLLAHVKTRAA